MTTTNEGMTMTERERLTTVLEGLLGQLGVMAGKDLTTPGHASTAQMLASAVESLVTARARLPVEEANTAPAVDPRAEPRLSEATDLEIQAEQASRSPPTPLMEIVDAAANRFGGQPLSQGTDRRSSSASTVASWSGSAASSSRASTLARYKAEIGRQREEIAELQRMIQSRDKRCAELEGELRAARMASAPEPDQLIVLRRWLVERDARIKELKELERLLDLARTDSNGLVARIRELEQRCEEVTTERDHFREVSARRVDELEITDPGR